MTTWSPNRRLRDCMRKDKQKSGYKSRNGKALSSDDQLIGLQEESYLTKCETKYKAVYIHVVPNGWLVLMLFCNIFPSSQVVQN